MLISVPAYAGEVKWYSLEWGISKYGDKLHTEYNSRCGVVESSIVRIISKQYDPQYVVSEKDSAGKFLSIKIKKAYQNSGELSVREFYRSESECKEALKKLEPDLNLYN